jgi:haloalkane dehalogenase
MNGLELPFGGKKFKEIMGRRMAYIDEGEGAPIVFAHGNPTSSYLWRNVMPACRGLGRLVACDMIGMGDSEKLPNSGPNSYTYAEHRDYLFALWEQLKLGNDIVFVLHDWGSALGFDWANQHRERVQALAFMEAFVMPIEWEDFPEPGRELFRALRSPAGDDLVLKQNIFIEKLLPGGTIRHLGEGEMAEYRRPYLTAGEDRRPMLAWPRQIPVGGEPADVVEVIERYGRWLAQSPIPKLYFHAAPGEVDIGRRRAFVRQWPNQKEIEVKGGHFVQEDSPTELGVAISEFVRDLRGTK